MKLNNYYELWINQIRLSTLYNSLYSLLSLSFSVSSSLLQLLLLKPNQIQFSSLFSVSISLPWKVVLVLSTTLAPSKLFSGITRDAELVWSRLSPLVRFSLWIIVFLLIFFIIVFFVNFWWFFKKISVVAEVEEFYQQCDPG